MQPEAYTIQHVTTTALAEQFREFGAAVPASPLKCLGERAAFAYATSLTTHTFRQVRVRVTPRLCVRARVQLIHASLFRAVCYDDVTWRVVFRMPRGVLSFACHVACFLSYTTWRVVFRMPRRVLSFPQWEIAEWLAEHGADVESW